jgi:arylsulfatase A-like enzyme
VRRVGIVTSGFLPGSIVGLAGAVLLAVGLSGCARPRVGPPNIVLVSIDTFRADRVGAIGNTEGFTPNLDRFAREGVVFTHAYSQATITGPSHLSMFTSRYPSEVAGMSRTANGSPDLYTLPRVLGTYGYQTAARTAGGDLAPAVGPTVGFDSYASSVNFGSLYHTVPLAMEWLDGADPARPFFLFIHGYDTHTTYLKPTPYGILHTGLSALTPFQVILANATERVVDGRLLPNFGPVERVTQEALRPRSPEGKRMMADLIAALPGPTPEVSPADQELIRRLYDGAVTYADTQFGLLMAQLAARGRLDDTVVVVMGDHGEALGEDGLFHRCCSLEDGLDHVPLIVRLPGGAHGGHAVDDVVELLDIMPTLLDLAGAVPPAGIQGTSLLPAIEGGAFAGRRVAITQAGFGMRSVSARSLAGRLTYSGVQASADVLADVVDAARLPGPAFEASAGADAAEQASLRGALVTWARSVKVAEPQADVEMPAELRESLRQHGYWDAK